MNLFLGGGITKLVLMGLLVLASTVGLAIIIERSFALRAKAIDVSAFIRKIKDLISRGSFDEALSLCNSISSPVGSLTRIILQNRTRGREELEKLVETEAQREMPILEKRLTALNTIASVAPLLGLLGTVTGMIKSFSVIAQGRVADAAMAGGISEALLTTAFGLTVAIPCIATYNFFARTVEKITTDMEVSSVELIEKVLSHRSAS